MLHVLGVFSLCVFSLRHVNNTTNKVKFIEGFLVPFDMELLNNVGLFESFDSSEVMLAWCVTIIFH